MAGTSIEFAPLLPWFLIAGLGGMALLVAGAGFYARARGALWRSIAFAALIATLLNPSLVNEQREPLRDVAVVVVDESASQRIGDRPERTAAALEKIRAEADALRATLDLRVIHVGREGLDTENQGTRLLEPLQRALSDVPERRVAGAILLTDGQVHDALPNPEAESLPRPLHVLLTGRRDEVDRRLVIVKAPTFGIVGKKMQMTVRIEDSTAAPDPAANLRIRRNGGDELVLSAPVGEEHTLEFTLDHAGQTVFELAVDPIPDELTEINNRAVVSINGVRDRLRVLLVSGEPHEGERTWRNLLKSDPSVDLVHFTILRPPEKQDGTPIDELSLISFPTRELFEVKLAEFDLVILDRYRRRGVLPSIYLQNIVDYVTAGGALLEAAGPSFAGPFSIYRTPLGAMLPGEPTGEIITRGYRPATTRLGLRHPVTADLPGGVETIGPDATSGEGNWGRWFRQIDVTVKQGHVLMDGADGRPLLILDRVGTGRVAQINSDHIWLWARGFEGGGPQAELLRRVSHWLMKEPELEENDLRAATRGDVLEVTRRNIDDELTPVEVTGPDGSTVTVPMERTGEGVFTGSITVSESGLYRVSDGAAVFMAAVGALNPLEFSNVLASPEPLQPTVEATGSAIHWLADSVPNLRLVAPERDTSGRGWIGLVANGDYIVTGLTTLPLLPALLVLLLALGATAIAWRREGD
ncbi:MAG: hypothetical protein WD767_08270 [Alphaproteobacteria bacterium]